MTVLKTTLGKKDEKMQASKINQRSLNKIYLDNIFFQQILSNLIVSKLKCHLFCEQVFHTFVVYEKT